MKQQAKQEKSQNQLALEAAIANRRAELRNSPLLNGVKAGQLHNILLDEVDEKLTKLDAKEEAECL